MNLKHCQKRHPKVCRRLAIEKFCRFGKSCSYHHQEEQNTEEEVNNEEIKKKIEDMEKALDGMGQKIIILEAEVKVLKLKCDNTYKKTEAEDKDDDSEKVPVNQGESLKEAKDSDKIVKDKEKKSDKIEFKAKLKCLPVKCNLCDYSCVESSNMKKHINNKHVKQKCNVCQKEFGTSLEVLQHVASEHCLESGESEINRDVVHDIVLKDNVKSTEEVFEDDVSEDRKWLFCDICEFKCENENGKNLKDHMNSKHRRSKSCNICSKLFKNNKSLMVHGQEEHGTEEAPRKRSFVWSESMLDEFL